MAEVASYCQFRDELFTDDLWFFFRNCGHHYEVNENSLSVKSWRLLASAESYRDAHCHLCKRVCNKAIKLARCTRISYCIFSHDIVAAILASSLLSESKANHRQPCDKTHQRCREGESPAKGAYAEIKQNGKLDRVLPCVEDDRYELTTPAANSSETVELVIGQISVMLTNMSTRSESYLYGTVPDARVYGSRYAGLALLDSDFNILVTKRRIEGFKGARPPSSQVADLKELAVEFSKQEWVLHCNFLEKAMWPIIKIETVEHQMLEVSTCTQRQSRQIFARERILCRLAVRYPVLGSIFLMAKSKLRDLSFSLPSFFLRLMVATWVKFKAQQDSITELTRSMFRFYSSFNYNQVGISLRIGFFDRNESYLEKAALFIEDPLLDQGQSVGRNLSGSFSAHVVKSIPSTFSLASHSL